MKYLALAILVSVCSSAVSATTETLYEQTARSSLSSGYFWNSLVDPDGSGAEVADRFTLSDASVVSEIGWYGYFAIFSDSLPTNNASDWNIRFYDGTNGNFIGLQTIADTAVDRSFLGNTDIFHNTLREEHFRFSSAIAPLSLDAGDYWMSIQSVNILSTDFSPTSGSVFAWDPSVDNSADNLSAQRGLPSGEFGTVSGDRAFSVSGAVLVVPEPSSLAMLSLIGISVGAYRIRRRNRDFVR